MRRQFHATDKGFAVSHVQDVQPVLERNKALQNNGGSKDKELRYVASIPPVIWYQWMQESGLPAGAFLRWSRPEFMGFVRKKLNSSEWQWLKTIPGKV